LTQASARAKGESESSLGIVFDKAILKNGQEIPLNVAIQGRLLRRRAVPRRQERTLMPLVAGELRQRDRAEVADAAHLAE